MLIGPGKCVLKIAEPILDEPFLEHKHESLSYTRKNDDGFALAKNWFYCRDSITTVIRAFRGLSLSLFGEDDRFPLLLYCSIFFGFIAFYLGTF
jgi:hypothetical protein